MSNKKEAQLIIIEAFIFETDVFFLSVQPPPPRLAICVHQTGQAEGLNVCVCVMWATWEAQVRNSLTEASNMK